MTHPKKQTRIGHSRLMPWTWLGGMLGLVFAGAALAADPLYENDSVLVYTVPPQILPAIDATNFLNNNWFEVDFTTSVKGIGPNLELYETEDTVNFTNIGTMVANSSILTNNFNLELSLSPGCGFNIDYFNTQSGMEQMAGNFYNPGSIRANSQVDLGQLALQASTVGKILVNATNIVNPGIVEVGVDSMVQFTGQSVDLTRGQLIMDSSGANVFGTGYFGVNTSSVTNGNVIYTIVPPWDPSIYLGANFAESGLFPIQPLILDLPNSTAYFQVDSVTPSNNIIRSVFIEDTSGSDVTYNVYFDTAGIGFGSGNVTIEWTGSYQDNATGTYYNNYLYLNNNYLESVATNDGTLGAIPFNFTFTESNTKQIFQAPAPAGFLNVFPAGTPTNRYAYMDVQLTAGTATPSQVANQAITNLPGRIQINASQELNLAMAQINGPNYMSLRSTNQFDGSPGALIQVPYSDLNLGVTNGFLTLSNLLSPNLPAWSGTCQAWSTEWVVTVTNTVGTNSITVTNDFRVLIVGSQLNPTTVAQVQDVVLHGTNTVVSDALNFIRTFTSDAQSLTLTTNGFGNGATSLDGELNLQLMANSGPYDFVWQNSLPNLRNLTNSGAIRMPNVNPVNMGSAASPYGAFINHGLVSDYGVTVYATNFESDGWFSNSVSGSFVLHSQTATLTNGLLYAGGDVSITSGNLVTSNLMLQANRSLTLAASSALTDTGPSPTNGNVWVVGSNSVGNGFSVPVKPASGDLLGTTVTLLAPVNKKVTSTWAGVDLGASPAGYTNNVAVGHLLLDAAAQAAGTQFYFTGAGVSNAIYVDRLELRDYASYTNHDIHGNLAALAFNTNLVIYYADAIAAGAGAGGTPADVSELINHKNNNQLRWVPTYAGYFSSTNLVFAGVTNTVNVALAQSHDIDSNGNGIYNAADPTPFFQSSMTSPVVISNTLSGLWAISWNSIPNATNVVFYSTNSSGPFTNLLVTFSTNSAGPFTMSNFISPIPYPSPPARVMIFTPILVSPPSLYYMPVVIPWTTYPY